MLKDAKLVQLIMLYSVMIQGALLVQDGNEHRFGDKTSLNHLQWMLSEILHNPEQSHSKKHRWIGFVQGLLIAYGITTVDNERDATRGILAGD